MKETRAKQLKKIRKVIELQRKLWDALHELSDAEYKELLETGW